MVNAFHPPALSTDMYGLEGCLGELSDGTENLEDKKSFIVLF